jgi:hypothetical protein
MEINFSEGMEGGEEMLRVEEVEPVKGDEEKQQGWLIDWFIFYFSC